MKQASPVGVVDTCGRLKDRARLDRWRVHRTPVAHLVPIGAGAAVLHRRRSAGSGPRKVNGAVPIRSNQAYVPPPDVGVV